MSKLKPIFDQLLSSADIAINGSRAWDIQVENPKVYKRVLHQTSLGLGESYMDRWWHCEQIDEMISRLIVANIPDQISHMGWNTFKIIAQKMNFIEAFLINKQSIKRAKIVGEQHYDIGNDLYQRMLDKNMVYTCGYWRHAKDLDQAQQDKLKLVCDKINLQPGQKILDIGCGWGSFAQFAAKHYGAKVVGITISKEQAMLAQKRCQGLPVEIRLEDYRNLNEPFDHIISLGMFEHVGYKNYSAYFKMAHRCLKDNGLFLLHTIGSPITVKKANPWIDKYIFPNGQLPSLKQIAEAHEGLFVVEDLQNFGADYDKTLMAWHENFSTHWSEIKAHYSERFYRQWTYYLLSCAGSFRARDSQLWQFVLSKKGIPGGYLNRTT